MAQPRLRLPDRRLVRTYSKKQWSVSQSPPISIRQENTLPEPVPMAARVGVGIMQVIAFLLGVGLIVRGFAMGQPVNGLLLGSAWLVVAGGSAIAMFFICHRVDRRSAEYQTAYVDPIEIELEEGKVRHRGLDKTRRAWVEEGLGGYRLRLLSRKVRKRSYKDTIATGFRTKTFQDIVLENVKEPTKSIFLYGEPGHMRSQRLMDNAQTIAEATGLALIESAVLPS